MGRGRPVVVVTTISASLRLTTALMVVAQASPRRAVTRIGVPGSWSLSGRAATDSVARVVAAQFHGDGPLQHGGNLLPDRLGGRRLIRDCWIIGKEREIKSECLDLLIRFLHQTLFGVKGGDRLDDIGFQRKREPLAVGV